MNRTTINSSYQSIIKDAATEPLLQQHIQDTNDWDDIMMQDVCWTSHKQALNRMPTQHKQLVKLCHDIMWMAKYVNCYNHD
jgi:hypothetical protein